MSYLTEARMLREHLPLFYSLESRPLCMCRSRSHDLYLMSDGFRSGIRGRENEIVVWGF